MKHYSPFEKAPRLIEVAPGEYLAMQIFGQGPTVVLEAPGVGIGIDGWADFPNRLAEHATVVVYDRLGVGLSHSQSAAFAMPEDHARHLEAALKQLPVQKPVMLIGWSMGGLIAQQFAAQNPEQVSALLLLDPTIFVYEKMVASPNTQGQTDDLRAKLLSLMKTAVMTPEGRRQYFKSILAFTGSRFPVSAMEEQFVRTPAWRHLALLAATAEMDQHKAAMAAQMAAAVRERGLPKVPTRLLLSTFHAPAAPREMIDAIESQFKEYEVTAAALDIGVTWLEGVSHQIPLEAPDECVAATVACLKASAELARN